MKDLLINSISIDTNDYDKAAQVILKKINTDMNCELSLASFIADEILDCKILTYESNKLKCHIRLNKKSEKIQSVYGCERKSFKLSDAVLAKMLLRKLKDNDYSYYNGIYLKRKHRMEDVSYEISDGNNTYEFVSKHLYESLVYYIRRIRILGINYE